MQHNLIDAQGINFVRQQSIVLSARAFEQQYDIYNVTDFVPVNTDYPEWASGVDFRGSDITTQAQWQSTYAKDVPLSDVRVMSVTSEFAGFSSGYRWELEEVGKAMYSGFPLLARKAAAARMGADLFVLASALNGGGHPGWTGLFNLAGVTPTVSPNDGTGSARNWVDANGVGLKTPEQIVKELNGLLIGPAATSGFAMLMPGDTILLPPLVYNYLAVTPYGITSPNDTILTWYMRNNIYTTRTGNAVTIREIGELATGATATSPNVAGQGRAIGYRNSRDALELPMPMPFRFDTDVYRDGPYNYAIPGYGRVGQLIQFTDSVRYLDGVSPAP